MKAVEDISESLNSLSQVISMSFSFAKSSPMKAKKSLMTCAEYLQSKTFKSTSFVIRFWLVLIDLLKNENVEILILTLLSMLQNVISLLKSKEVQTIITSALKIAGSEPVTKIMVGITKCVKSLFYIIKTPEIAKFQKQIWELIEDEQKKEKEKENDNDNEDIEKQQRRKASRCSQVAIPGMDVIQEGYYNDYGNLYDENGNYIARNMSDSEHELHELHEHEDEDDEETKENLNDLDNVSTPTNASNTSYYSPARAWYGLTSIPSIVFGGYNQESDRSNSQSQDDEISDNCIAGIDNDVDNNDNHQSLDSIKVVNIEDNESKDECDGVDGNMNVNVSGRQRRSKSVTSISTMRPNRKIAHHSRRSLSYDGKGLSKGHGYGMNHHGYGHRTPHGHGHGMMMKYHKEYAQTMNSNMNLNMNMNHQHINSLNMNNNMSNNSPTSSGSVTINDWVSLIHYIDELEDNGDISINEGDGMRKLALEETMALLIIFKCYDNKKSRFIRYARNIMNETKEAKMQKNNNQNNNCNNSAEITVSLDDVKVNNDDIDNNINGNGDIVCID